MVLQRFVSVCGFPKSVCSDRGAQLMVANKEHRAMVKNWNMAHILDFASIEGMLWHFDKSAEAP